MSQFDEAVAPDDREAKLPVWAQLKLRSLRQVAVSAYTDLSASLLASKPEESDAVLNPYGNFTLGLTEGQGLGKRAMVRFQFAPRIGIDCRLTSDGRWLLLQADGRLSMTADATNSWRLQVVDR